MIKCWRCKQVTTSGRNIRLYPSSKKQHIVCYSCYERLHNHRSKRAKEGTTNK